MQGSCPRISTAISTQTGRVAWTTSTGFRATMSVTVQRPFCASRFNHMWRNGVIEGNKQNDTEETPAENPADTCITLSTQEDFMCCNCRWDNIISQAREALNTNRQMALTLHCYLFRSSEDIQFLLFNKLEMKHKRESQSLVILAGETSLANPSPRFPQVEVGPCCGFFLIKHWSVPPMLRRLTRSPYVWLTCGESRPVGGTVTLLLSHRSCREQRYGQGVWASKAAKYNQPSGKKFAGAFQSTYSYWHGIWIQMHIIRLQEGRKRITLAQLDLLKFTTFTSKSKSRSLC